MLSVDNRSSLISLLSRNYNCRYSGIVLFNLTQEHNERETVFISPDRSPEEPSEHHRLVLNMKEKAKEDSIRRYYIRSGNICHSPFRAALI